MLFYILILIFVATFCILADRGGTGESDLLCSGVVKHTPNTRLFFVIAALILILVAGLRYYVGTDFGAYYKGYGRYAATLMTRIKNFDEPGYSLIASIAKLIWNDGACAILLASIVTLGLETRTIYKHSDKLFLSTLFFVFLGCWHGTFNGVRQFLAVAVLFCGMTFLQERKFWKYLLVVFLAALCHRSALVMIILYFVVNRKITFLNVIITMLAAWLILAAYERLFTFAEWLLEKDIGGTDFANTSVNMLRIAAACMPAIFFLIANINQEITKEEAFYMNILILYAALSVMTMQSALLQRASLYMAPFQAMAIPQMLKTLRRRMKPIMTAITVSLYLVFWLYDISVRGAMIPYKTIFMR